VKKNLWTRKVSKFSREREIKVRSLAVRKIYKKEKKDGEEKIVVGLKKDIETLEPNPWGGGGGGADTCGKMGLFQFGKKLWYMGGFLRITPFPLF